MVNLHIPGRVVADSIQSITQLLGASLRGSTVGGKVLVYLGLFGLVFVAQV